MSEKISEHELSACLQDFPQEHIYYHPCAHPILKSIFKHSSKKGAGYGIPDRIFFDGSTLILFECKKSSLQLAIDDLKLYNSSLNLEESYTIYFVAFVDSGTYLLLDCHFDRIEKDLCPLTFNLNKCMDYTKDMLEKDIQSIHNYIRDYTKISNEDKCFFSAVILISLSRKSFRDIISRYDSKEYLYDLLESNLKEHDLDISIFMFLRTDNNNKHLYELVKKFMTIYMKNPNIDLLNHLYSEFIKYNNMDGKSLGIVLTPPHIVSLMIDLLNLKPSDTFLDLCAGTGSFVMEAYRKCNLKQMIACEYQTKLFNLLKCNATIRNIPKSKLNFHRSDCFDREFRATKSAINPPYGMKDKNELDFVMKQLNSVVEGGLVSCIIPISCLTNSSKRREITSCAIVRRIVLCNENLFYNSGAGVKCIILLLEKNMNGHSVNDSVLFSDYEDDGYIMARGYGRITTDTFQTRYLEVLSKAVSISIDTNGNDWISVDLYHRFSKKDFKRLTIQMEYFKQLLSIEQTMTNDLIDYESSSHFKLVDLFYLLKKPRESYPNIGEQVFLISARNHDNGVKQIIQATEDTFTGNKIVLVTGGNGGAGLAFYQPNPFSITSATLVLEPKIPMSEKLGMFIALECSKYKKKYSRGYQWSLSRLEEDTIELPTRDGEIDTSFIESQ